MQNLIKSIKTPLKWLLLFLLSVTLVAILGCYGGILHIYQILWTFVKISLQLQPPLWALLALGLVVLAYIYLKIKKFHSLQNLQNTTYIEKISELEKQIEIQNLDLLANIIEKNLSQDNTIGTLNERIKALENPDQYSHKVDALNKELKKIINHTNKT